MASDPDDSPPDLSGLLDAARGGDAVALGALMDWFRRYLLKVAAAELPAHVRLKVPPSDVVQDALLEAYRLFERFEGAGAAEFRGWLAGIVRNKVRDSVRRFAAGGKRDAGREVAVAGSGGADPAPSLSSEAVRREEAEAVLAALARLPAEYRAAIQLRTWDGLPFAEVGARTGRTEDAARMLFARAMKRLEEELEYDPG